MQEQYTYIMQEQIQEQMEPKNKKKNIVNSTLKSVANLDYGVPTENTHTLLHAKNTQKTMKIDIDRYSPIAIQIYANIL